MVLPFSPDDKGRDSVGVPPWVAKTSCAQLGGAPNCQRLVSEFRLSSRCGAPREMAASRSAPGCHFTFPPHYGSAWSRSLLPATWAAKTWESARASMVFPAPGRPINKRLGAPAQATLGMPTILHLPPISDDLPESVSHLVLYSLPARTYSESDPGVQSSRRKEVG
jgi:hypothetical protein